MLSPDLNIKNIEYNRILNAAPKSVRLMFLLLFIAFVFLYFYLPLEIEDGWWHLSAARWIADHNQVPHEDVFSFSEKPAPWIYTQWLGSLIFYGVGQMGGAVGLKMFRALVFTLAIGLFILRGSHKVAWPVIFVLALILVHGL